MHSMRDKALNWGFGVSLCLHALALVVFVPVIRPVSQRPIVTRAAFLGVVLGERDLSFFARAQKGPGSGESLPSVSPNQPRVQGLVSLKPQWSSAATLPQGAFSILESVEPRGGASPAPVRELTLDFSSANEYLLGADFKELERLARRREIAGSVDLRVLLNARGQVQEVQKVAGSGDPYVDLALTSVLRRSIFNTERVPGGYWLRVKFVLKSGEAHVRD